MNYLSLMGKNYSSMEEMKEQKAQFEKAKAIIDSLNANSHGNSSYDLNYFADMTDAEF